MLYDVALRDVQVYDGGGEPSFRADVALYRGRIEAVGEVRAEARATLEGNGLCVMPGGIDLHTHSDTEIKKDPAAATAVNFLRQGCVTVVSGNCGGGTLDVASYFEHLRRLGLGVNLLHLVGHGTLRRAVMGEDAGGDPTSGQIEAMRNRLRRALDEGAAGMSSGLNYLPGAYSRTGELEALAAVLAEYDALYASHIRHEGEGLLEAVDEIIRIGASSGARVHLSHIKCLGSQAWGRAAEVCARLERARAAGVRITADQYPYTASSTSLRSMVTPLWARHAVREKLEDPSCAPRLREEIAVQMERRGGAEGLLIVDLEKKPEWKGRRVSELAEETGLTPLETCLLLLKEYHPKAVGFSMREEDVRYFMARPYVATASDGSAQPEQRTGPVHPRSYGAFARKLSHYARDGGGLSMEQAVRSVSGLPADILGIADRGYIRPGYAADLAVFNPRTLADHATFESPRRCACGLRRVWVNGRAAIEDDAFTGEKAGRPLRRGGRAVLRMRMEP